MFLMFLKLSLADAGRLLNKKILYWFKKFTEVFEFENNLSNS